MHRSDDAGLSWTEISDGLPTEFGFAAGAHPHDRDTFYVIPLDPGHGRCMPDGSAAVWRTPDAGATWQQASVPAIRHVERRLVGNGLAPGIDHPRADRRVLRPPRHETPAHANELAVALGIDADDRHVRHRGDVVTGLQLRRLPEAERQCDRGRMTVQFVAAAHDQSPGVEALSARVALPCSGVVVASTPRAVRATCSVSQYA